MSPVPMHRSPVARHRVLLAAVATLAILHPAAAWSQRVTTQGRPATAARADSLAEGERHLAAGRAAFDAKRFDDAAEHFRRATELRPRDAVAFRWLGNAYIQQAMAGSMITKATRGPKARDAWERAAALDPREVESREYLVSYYEGAPGMLGGGADKARAMAREVQAIDPYRGTLLQASLAERAREFAAAEALYASAAAMPADSGRGLEGWLVALESQQKFAEAFAAVDARLAAHPGDYIALYHLGRIAGLSGQRADAGMAALERALALPVPPMARFKANGIHYWRGMLYEARGALPAAESEYLATLALAPGDRNATAALARVRAARKP